MSRQSPDSKPIEHLLGDLLLPGEDGDIADSSVEEFLRLYDELCVSLSPTDLEQVKERTREAARDTETRQIASQIEHVAVQPDMAAMMGSGGEVVQVREMSFHPAELDVSSGEEVRWVAAPGCNMKHSLEVFNNWTEQVVAESPPLASGQQFSWTFREKGEYTVSSCVYSFMQAKVFVDFPMEDGKCEDDEEGAGVQDDLDLEAATLESADESAAGAENPRAALLPLSLPEDKSPACKPPLKTRHADAGEPMTVTAPPAVNVREAPAPAMPSESSQTPSLPGKTQTSGVVPPPSSSPCTDSPCAPPAARRLPIAVTMERPQSPRVPAPQLRDPAEPLPAPNATGLKAAEAMKDLKGSETPGERINHRYRGYEAEAEEEPARRAEQTAADPAPPGTAEAAVPEKNLGPPAAEEKQPKQEAAFPPEEQPPAAATPADDSPAPGKVTATAPEGHNNTADAASPPCKGPPSCDAAGGSRREALSGRNHRCRVCHAAYISYINLQRCNARHHAKKKLNKQGPGGRSSGTLPAREEFLDFWGALGPDEAATLLCLRNPGETGEILLQEAAAAGLGLDAELTQERGEGDNLGTSTATSPAVLAPEKPKHRSKLTVSRPAYRAAAERLYHLVGGEPAGGSGFRAGPPVLPTGVELLELLHTCSEGTVLLPGARARGSLADMMLPSNLGASLALLVEGQLVEAWRVQQEVARGEEQRVSGPMAPPTPQKEAGPSPDVAVGTLGHEGQQGTAGSGSRAKPRKPRRKKKNRRAAALLSGEDATEGDTTTTFDEATTTDAEVGEADNVVPGFLRSADLLPLNEQAETSEQSEAAFAGVDEDDTPFGSPSCHKGPELDTARPQAALPQEGCAESPGEDEPSEDTDILSSGPLSPPPAIRFGTMEMDEPIQFGTLDIGELLGGSLDAEKVHKFSDSIQAANAAAAPVCNPLFPSGLEPPLGATVYLPNGHIVHNGPVPAHPLYGMPHLPPQIAVGVPVDQLHMLAVHPAAVPVHNAPMVLPQVQGVSSATSQMRPDGIPDAPLLAGSPPTNGHPHPSTGSPPQDIQVQGFPPTGEQEAAESRPAATDKAVEKGELEQRDSLQQANAFFADVLQKMQAADASGRTECQQAQNQTPPAREDLSGPEPGERAGSADTNDASPLQTSSSHACVPQHNGHAPDPDETAGAAPAWDSESLQLQDRLVFDPELARRLLRQQWLLAEADLRSGIGKRHVSNMSAPQAAARRSASQSQPCRIDARAANNGQCI